jgi:uncharacterized membrane protein YfcA
MIWFIGHLLAAFIGLSLGLIGGGGSILALPILVYVMGIPPKPAVAMTLVIVGTVSLLGVIPHWRAGNVNLKKVALFGPATMVGAYLGARLAGLVTDSFQMLLFAAVMLLASVLMLRDKKAVVQIATLEDGVYVEPVYKYYWLWLLTVGIAVGVLTGLVGVGGGFAVVPALVLLGKTSMKEAIGSSLLIIALNSVTGFLGYLGEVDLNWGLMGSFIIAASLGTIGGAYLSQFVQASQLRKGFAFFLLAMGAFILFQNRAAFL